MPAKIPPHSAIPLQPISKSSSKVTPSSSEISSGGTSHLKKRPGSLALKTITSPDGPPSDAKFDSEKSVRPARPTSLATGQTSRPTTLSGLNNVMEVADDASDGKAHLEDRKRLAQQALPPVARPTSLSGGLAITPLMAKLSHLAMDRHGSVMTPADATPCEPKEISFPNRGNSLNSVFFL